MQKKQAHKRPVIQANRPVRRRANASLDQIARLQEQANLLELAHDAIIVRDMDSRITFWNHGAEQTYGWTRKQALGHVTHTFLRTRFPVSFGAVQNALLTEGRWEGELIHTTRAGRSIVIASRQVLQKDSDGQPCAILEINRDMTETKRAEDALRESEERYRLLFERNVAGMFRSALDPRTLKARRVDCNAAYVRMFGYASREEMLQQPAQASFFSPEDWQAYVRRLVEEKSIVSYETRFRHKDGHPFWGSVSVGVREIPGDSLLLIEGTIVDITGRKQAEEHARVNAARAEALLRVAARLNARLDLQALLNAICEEVARALNIPAAAVTLYNKERRIEFLAAQTGLPQRLEENALIEQLLRRTDSVAVLSEAQITAARSKENSYAESAIRTVAVAAMQRDGERMGALGAMALDEAHPFDQAQLDLLKGLADIAAQAILNARLHAQVLAHAGEMEQRVRERTEELESANRTLQAEMAEREQAEDEIMRRNREMQVLYEVSRAATQPLKLDELLDHALHAVTDALDIEAGSIRLLEPDGKTMKMYAHRGLSDEFVTTLSSIQSDEGVAGIAASRKKPKVATISEYPAGRMAQFIQREGFRAIASTPLLSRGEVVGSLSLATRRPRAFPPEELELLGAIGEMLGKPVRTVRLMAALERELEERKRIDAERQRLMQQLDAERARWQATVESMIDPVTVADAEGHAIYMNAAYSQMVQRHIQLGLDLSEHPTFYQLYHPDGTLFNVEDLPLQRAALTGREERGVELIQRAADGEEHIAIWNAAPLCGADGRVTGAVAVGRDITEQRRAEAERERLLVQVAEERDKFKTLVESIVDEVWYSDAAGNVTQLNAAATRGLGFNHPVNEPLRQLVSEMEVLYPDGRPRPIEATALYRSLRGETILNEENLVRHLKTGEMRHRSYSAAPVLDHSGKVIGAVTVVRDITESKKAAAEIERLNKVLEQRATELEIANQELEAFSYSISHDLRTPLSAICEFSRLLMQTHSETLAPAERRYLELLNGNAEEMIGLVNALLDFSRLIKQPLRKKTVAIAELAQAALAELRSMQEGRRVEITIGDLPPCDADPVLLKRVYVNLLSNALKFTRSREIARIEIGYGSADGEMAYFVRDNGVGFDVEEADRLFGVFQRFHSDEEYEGTGVGLAIVQRVVHRHGGRVWAEAQPDQGATFYFTL